MNNVLEPKTFLVQDIKKHLYFKKCIFISINPIFFKKNQQQHGKKKTIRDEYLTYKKVICPQNQIFYTLHSGTETGLNLFFRWSAQL